MEIKKDGLFTCRLHTTQILPVEREEAFTFFEDPRNLFGITPSGLAVRICDPDRVDVSENAQFDYTIRWLGFRMRWRSRIIDYLPPEQFTDVQVIGPYRYWKHKHSLVPVEEGTLMEDEVLYCLPFFAAFLYPIIRRQLRDIFTYRAIKIEEWALGKTRFFNEMM